MLISRFVCYKTYQIHLPEAFEKHVSVVQVCNCLLGKLIISSFAPPVWSNSVSLRMRTGGWEGPTNAAVECRGHGFHDGQRKQTTFWESITRFTPDISRYFSWFFNRYYTKDKDPIGREMGRCLLCIQNKTDKTYETFYRYYPLNAVPRCIDRVVSGVDGSPDVAR